MDFIEVWCGMLEFLPVEFPRWKIIRFLWSKTIFYLWGLVESLVEKNVPNVGLVSLITLKTGKLLTVLNNSPSLHREVENIRKSYLFHPWNVCIWLFFQVNFCIKSTSQSLLQIIPDKPSLPFHYLAWTDKEKGNGSISSLLRQWLDLQSPRSSSTAKWLTIL